MKKIYDFLKDCGVFYVLSINGDFPAGRPFTAVMELDDKLYFSTGASKPVSHQLKAHPPMQLIALHPSTRKWLRLSGLAKECCDLTIKEKMMEACPNLRGYFPTTDHPEYAVFQIEPTKEEWN